MSVTHSCSLFISGSSVKAPPVTLLYYRRQLHAAAAEAAAAAATNNSSMDPWARRTRDSLSNG